MILKRKKVVIYLSSNNITIKKSSNEITLTNFLQYFPKSIVQSIIILNIIYNHNNKQNSL